MIEYVLYERDEKGYNSVYLGEIDRKSNRITNRTIKQNSLVLLRECKCKYGTYNIDILDGPESIIKDSEYYECCVGYANIEYSEKGIKVLEAMVNNKEIK